MNYLNILSFVKALFLAKKKWSKPRKTTVLIYDRTGAENFECYFNTKDIEVFDVRGESVNIFIVLRFILMRIFTNSDHNYNDCYISFVNPKILITFIDNSLEFYRIKQKHPNLLTLFIQNGLRGGVDDVFSVLNEGKDVNHFMVDHMLTFNWAVGREYLRFIDGKVTPIGSLKNNHYKYTHNFTKRTILFISQFREKPANPTALCFWSLYTKALKFILPHINKFCQDNNYKLQICGSQEEGNAEEYSTFRSAIGNTDWDFFPRKNLTSSYGRVDSAEYIVCVNSTLGYEAFALGKKTIFISVNGIGLNRVDYNFGWPVSFSDSGPFWTNTPDEHEIKKMMNYITTVSDEEWKTIRKKYLTDIIEYDPGNKKFIQLMKELEIPLNVNCEAI